MNEKYNQEDINTKLQNEVNKMFYKKTNKLAYTEDVIRFPEEFDKERIQVFDIINNSKMSNYLWILYLKTIIDDLKNIQ